MSRWHKATCSAPQVIVERGSPRCTACDSEPDVEGLIREQKFSGHFAPPPPDEPLGQLNLHWPSSVPYTSANNSTETREASKEENGETAVKPNDSSCSKSTIYASRLASNEFRLICLPSSNHVDDPIHFDLEVYENERCPEYETTSYTWADEDGNGSFCKPIFIGQYWDVLLQTRNCWSMLRLMRPLKRFRMIWVDAICINQKDVEERDAQVFKMSQIYAECRSAYVYLGPDIVKPTAGKYPLRRQLQLADSQDVETNYVSNDKINLGRLLQRRYFKRIWVIQELVLSRHAVFQVGDIEFWMNSTTMGSISSHSSLDWAKTEAPWLEHLGQQRFQEKDLLQILYATSKSHCTDPRDKIYGILALVNASQFPLRANYKLSCQHVFFGTCAHILLNLKNLNILRQAVAMGAWGRHPSWLPNLKSADSRWSFQHPNSKYRTLEETSFQTWRNQQEGKTDSRFYHVSAEPQRWLSDKEIRFHDIEGALTTPALDDERRAQIEQPWNQGATIDTATGALSINLVHLHAFHSSPVQVADSDELRFFKVQSTPVSMFLSAETALDKHVQPGRDHLFILDQGDSTCIFLILSKVGADKAFRLLTFCYHVTFEVPMDTSLTPFETSSLPRSGRRRLENSLFVVDLQRSLHQVLQTVDLSRSYHRDWRQSLMLFLKYEKKDGRSFTGLWYRACLPRPP
ncbi:heterokaryon incompatibility HET-6 [Fusarium albosuccineum]|uniref:Heterokaryon incompatibility HET-6 n=1 Tax=Fusarium albosuccineum TaxID=1237068 RepID=A0A8H4KLS0_9HYPO|nr:heterokaryon incompatibility HET-6 [Fusarium albosuccineum]